MESKYKWNLKEIFKDKEDFNNAKTLLKKDLEDIKSYKGKLCDSSENLYNCYYKYEKALEKLEKLYAYGMLKYHLDMSNQEGIKLFKEVEGLEAEFGTVVSFITPEITYADTNKIKQYLKENSKLKRYERIINEILEDKAHILSQEEEKLLANYAEVFSAPENIFDILTNAEFEFGDLVDEDGKKIKMTDSTYTLYLKRVEKVDVYNRNKEKTGKIIYREKGASLNRDEFIISITAWIVNSTGKILMTQRRLDKDKGGMWEPTTGLIQSGETSTNGALRELKEEIGIELNVEDIKLVQEFVEEITDLNFFRDIYLVNKEIPLEQIKFIDGEVINAKYVTIDEFNEMIKNGEAHSWLNYFNNIYKKYCFI